LLYRKRKKEKSSYNNNNIIVYHLALRLAESASTNDFNPRNQNVDIYVFRLLRMVDYSLLFIFTMEGIQQQQTWNF